jgi:hypothetical protein
MMIRSHKCLANYLSCFELHIYFTGKRQAIFILRSHHLLKKNSN